VLLMSDFKVKNSFPLIVFLGDIKSNKNLSGSGLLFDLNLNYTYVLINETFS